MEFHQLESIFLVDFLGAVFRAFSDEHGMGNLEFLEVGAVFEIEFVVEAFRSHPEEDGEICFVRLF